MSKRFLFVGEKPSVMADKKDIVWADGGLAAKQLFDGLRANQIDPRTCVFLNLFGDTPEDSEHEISVIAARVAAIMSLARTNRLQIVAMGNKVSKRLQRHHINHLTIVHPAARGSIRAKATYAAHIGERLAA